MNIKGEVALVTGGAVRVGRALTLALAGAGADVFVHYNRSADAARETASEAESLGVRTAIGSANLSDLEAANSLVEQATTTLGTVSILVNSASGFPTDTIRDVTPEGFLQTIDLSLAAPIMLTSAFADALPEQHRGAVVNITDVRTEKPYREHFSYIVAKGGIDEFTRAAAVALAPQVTVNAIALGVILPPPGEDQAFIDRLAKRLPMERPGGTDPVAATLLYLVSNDFVTGEIVRVDGGGHLV